MDENVKVLSDHAEVKLEELYSTLMGDVVSFLGSNGLLEVVNGISLSVKFRPEFHESLGEEENAFIFTPDPESSGYGRMYHAQTED